MASETIPAVGTKVGARFGQDVSPAVIIEHRGVIHGQHIVRVLLGDGSDRDAFSFELAVDELEPAPAEPA